uniref:AA9 family lytic polysaccharide monooxygenase n=1 Tax=Heterobasidion parviporum TaxID=207832 RepID=I7CDY0_9AGAM|nr:glycoside hydrolase family 61 protein I [Heterobasidion parviporum]
MLFKSSLVVAVTFAVSVSAHTIFQEVYVNGVDQGHITGIRVPDYDGPITDVTSNDLICNGGINPYHQPMSTAIITVPAGAQVTTEWHHTLAGADPSDSADPIDPSHKGPIIAYLAKVPSATQSTVTGLQWFKIYEDGMKSDQSWGVDRLIANKGKVSFTIPSCIEAGQYLLRAEIIALHGASSYPGAQFYMECAQLQITGGGSTSPATVSFPGAYSGTDPGIKINIYQTLPSYTVPGPAVFSCNGSTAPAPSSSSAVASTSSAASPTSSAASPPQGSGTPVTHYGQCGGLTYTGSTACASPYTCTYSSDYYSQCL